MAIEVLGQVLAQRALQTPPNLEEMDASQNKILMLIQSHKFHVPNISVIHTSVIYVSSHECNQGASETFQLVSSHAP